MAGLTLPSTQVPNTVGCEPPEFEPAFVRISDFTIHTFSRAASESGPLNPASFQVGTSGIITRVPVLIGSGIPLFGAVPRDIVLRHVGTRQYASGLVQSAYEVIV